MHQASRSGSFRVVLTAAACALALVLAACGDDGDDAGGSTSPQSEGQAIYQANCQVCHGPQGQGGIGPEIGGGVVAGKYPDVADEIEIVTNGRGGMRSFEGALTPEEIEAVVEYTRTDLGN